MSWGALCFSLLKEIFPETWRCKSLMQFGGGSCYCIHLLCSCWSSLLKHMFTHLEEVCNPHGFRGPRNSHEHVVISPPRKVLTTTHSSVSNPFDLLRTISAPANAKEVNIGNNMTQTEICSLSWHKYYFRTKWPIFFTFLQWPLPTLPPAPINHMKLV